MPFKIPGPTPWAQELILSPLYQFLDSQVQHAGQTEPKLWFGLINRTNSY